MQYRVEVIGTFRESYIFENAESASEALEDAKRAFSNDHPALDILETNVLKETS